jgi:hypothetical protein
MVAPHVILCFIHNSSWLSLFQGQAHSICVLAIGVLSTCEQEYKVRKNRALTVLLFDVSHGETQAVTVEA